jgi:probable phosphoglycerate mutase
LLENRGITRVIASNLARAGETARIVSRALGIGLIALDGDLRERSFGCFEGLTREECADRFPEDWGRYSLDRRVTPEGAESHDDVLRRMKGAVDRAVSVMSGGESTLLVSHGGSIRIWFAATTGQPLRPVGNGEVLRFALIGGALEYEGTLEPIDLEKVTSS